MSAPKPTGEQTAAGKLLADHAFGYGSMSEEEYANASLFYAMKLAEREAAAEQRGREAGIREALDACAAAVDALPTSSPKRDGASLCVKRVSSLLDGFPPLAQYGAARVPGVDAGSPDDEETDR